MTPADFYTAATQPDFPWGMPIGAFTPDGFPALLPTTPGGLLLRFDLSTQATVVQVIETAVLGLVDALPNRALEVHVIDYAIRKPFQHLAQLASLRLYRLYDTN